MLIKGKYTSKVYLAILIFAIFITYSPLLDDSFWADDYLHIERINSLGSSALFKDFFTAWVLKTSDTSTWWTSPAGELQYFRPLISLSFFLDLLLWGMNPLGFHLTNVIFHIFTSILVFLLAKLIFKKELTAFLLALIFGIHPCHMEAVVWISCRTDVIAGFFYFFSLFCFLKFRQRENRGRFFLFALSTVLYTCALLSKEMAVTLPIILIAFDLFYSSTPKNSTSWNIRLNKSIFVYLPFFIITIIYLCIRFKIFGGLGSVPYPFSYSPLRPGFFLFFFRNLILYFANILYFVPIDLMIAYPFFVKHPILLFLLAGLVVGSIFLLAKFMIQRKKALLLFLLGLFTLIPVSFLSIGQRFLYIPSVCFFLCLGYLTLESWPRRKAIIVGYIAVIFFVSQIGNFINDTISCYSDQIKNNIKPWLQGTTSPRKLYFIDLPMLALIGLPHALRLECPDAKFSAEILSISPDIFPTDHPFHSYLKSPDPYTLIIGQTDDTYFKTYLEQAFLGGETDFNLEKIFIRNDFTVKISKLKEKLPQEFIFKFNSPLTAINKIFFRGENLRVYPIKVREN